MDNQFRESTQAEQGNDINEDILDTLETDDATVGEHSGVAGKEATSPLTLHSPTRSLASYESGIPLIQIPLIQTRAKKPS
jgi:hypothetical protein